jgi:signal transduction histidine kinase
VDTVAGLRLSLAMSGLRRALIGLAIAGLAAGLGVLALALTSDHNEERTFTLALAVGWSFIGAGLYAWWRRPEHRMGPLMTLVGFIWFVGGLAYANSALVFNVGILLSSLWVGALGQMLVTYPSGRAETRLERWLIAAAWTAGLLGPLTALFGPIDPGCEDCPENLVLITANPTAADAVDAASSLLIVVLLAGIGVLFLRRWRAAGPAQRRVLAPVLWAGAAVAAFGTVDIIAFSVGLGELSDALDWPLLFAICAVPLGFLLGLMRASLGRAGAMSELVERLGRGRAPGTVRDALATALGDPTLELAYWLPDPARYVDAAGREVTLPGPGESRAATEIEHDGRRVAAIVHDAVLLDQPELVRAAGAAAALALENERLDAELRARYEELRASRARLVAAADAARRRIERDLHDGAQQRFVSLALTLRLARNRVEADSQVAELLDRSLEELDAGLGELRELARGIHPAVLSERGLGPALESLAARAPVPVRCVALPDERLPLPVETAAYFVVAEALTNVARYAQASEADVAVTRENGRAVIEVRDDGIGGADPKAGSGLRGIEDRVAALDGRLAVRSPVGGGTVVRAEIPVGGASR